MVRFLVTSLVLVFVFASPLLATRVVFQEGVDGYTGCEDTYMIDYHVETNFGSAIYIECQTEDGRDGGSRMRPLIRYNNLQLAGHTVTACTLQIYCYFAHGEHQRLELHEVLRGWKEFQATCVNFANGRPWTDFACGCNDEDASSAWVSSIVDSGGTGWISFPLPVDLVQRWVDAPGDTNDGVLVSSPEDEAGAIKDRSCRSSDMFASSYRPRLIIHHAGPCTGLLEEPVIISAGDVPNDAGGFARLTWQRSIYDGPGSDLSVKRYKVWRKRSQQIPPTPTLGFGPRPTATSGRQAGEAGPVWELVGRVRATGACQYTFDAPTFCDSSGVHKCLTAFYISAHTEVFGECFNSGVCEVYSVNNLLLGRNGPETGNPEEDGLGSNIPDHTRLTIPGPNPTTRGLAVRLDLPHPEHVKLDVYDVMGRLVITLAEAYMEAGSHSITWDYGDKSVPRLPPGVYFVSLATPAGMQTEKFVLVK